MCDFKVGDEVVCVDAEPDIVDPKANLLVEGQTYVVALMDVHPDFKVPVVAFRNVRVEGHPNKGYGFSASRFRKVQRRNIQEWLSQSVGNTDKLDNRQKVGA